MEDASAAALLGLGLPLDFLSRLAEARRLALWRPSERAEDSAVPYARVFVMFGNSCAPELQTLWTVPYVAWIEASGSDAGAAGAFLERASAGGLFACVTTKTVQCLGLANGVACSLASWMPLTETQRNEVELALHEAISNAMLHGNLEMPSFQGLSVEDLDRFGAEYATKLDDPRFGDRRVEVVCRFDAAGVTIEVADQGKGFTVKPVTEPKASGRGLAFISAMTASHQILDGGRRIRMRFQW